MVLGWSPEAGVVDVVGCYWKESSPEPCDDSPAKRIRQDEQGLAEAPMRYFWVVVFDMP